MTHMTAQELRIGNLVWEDYGGIYEVSKITHVSVRLRKHKGMPEGFYSIENIKPIPLTEEWIEKLGFGKDIFGRYTFYDMLNMSGNLKGYYLHTSDEWSNETVICENIKNVHQLQNLYYAITGEELTIQQPQP